MKDIGSSRRTWVRLYSVRYRYSLTPSTRAADALLKPSICGIASRCFTGREMEHREARALHQKVLGLPSSLDFKINTGSPLNICP